MKLRIYLLFILAMSLEVAMAQQPLLRFELKDSIVLSNASDASGQWVDMNGNGRYDFLTSASRESGEVVLLFVSTNSFRMTLDTLDIEGFHHPSFRIADVDNNNRPDIVVKDTAAISNKLTIFYQTNVLEFVRQDIVEPDIRDFEIVDLDNDGFKDLISYGRNDNVPFLTVHKNLEERRWRRETIDIDHDNIQLLELLDYDNNGMQDFIIHKESSGSYSTKIWLNKKESFEEAEISLPVLSDLVIAKGDLNADGKFDLLLSGTDSTSQFKTYLHTNEAGNEQINLLNDSTVIQSFMADFTSDGLLDIAITGQGFGSNFLLVNDSTGFNSEPLDSAYLSGFQEYADVECDGDLDFMTISVADGIKLYLFENVTPEENIGPSIVQDHIALPTDDGVVIRWIPSEDDLTDSSSLTYDVFIGFESLEDNILTPDFTLGTSTRTLVNFGNSGFSTEKAISLKEPNLYNYAIQSLDNAFYAQGCKGGAGGDPCPLGAVACGTFVLCEELTFENIRTCPNDTLTFTAENELTGWYSADQGFLGVGKEIQYQTNEADTIFTSIPNGTACDDNKAWVVEIEELALNDLFGCLGDLIDLAVPAKYDSAQWHFIDSSQELSGREVSFELEAATQIAVEAFIGNCSVRDTLSAVISEPILAIDGEQFRISSGGEVQLSASGGERYQWFPEQTLDNPNIPNPTASPIETTTYTVEITDSIGCVSSGEVLVIVEQQAFIPNLFSPNDDGKNDVLLIYGIREANEFDFRVFSRGGNLVFSTTDVQEMISLGWDGSTNGKEQASGVYYWEVKGEFPDGQGVLLNGRSKGAVYLVK